MKELNLGEEIINTTMHKIDFICSKNGYSEDPNRLVWLSINGNGDGNGNN
jgi:hypothetical protein